MINLTIDGSTVDPDSLLRFLRTLQQATVNGNPVTILMPGITNPDPPPVGNVLLHAHTTDGFTRFEQDNEAHTNLVLGRDSVFVVKNDTVSTIGKGYSVYVTGHDGNVPTVALAKADSETTMPAIGVILDDIVPGAFGQCMRLGIFSGFDFSSFTDGTVFYLSPSLAGLGTTTRPVSPDFVQTLGVVLSASVNGSVLVTLSSSIGGVESGTTAASFNAPAYSVGGTPGLASFSGAVSNITVVNGIVTAAS